MVRAYVRRDGRVVRAHGRIGVLSVKARVFVSRKVGLNVREGRPVGQAVVIAYGQARRVGFRVPVRRVKR